MITIDANILLYAYNESATQHMKAREWLESVLSGSQLVGLSWLVILAFIRITTNPRAFPQPFTLDDSVEAVSAWLERPTVSLMNPSDRHWGILRELLTDGQARGPLAMDAHLAALAIENGATLFTSDRDFARFKGLSYINPLETV
jgi:uncharacterized protein